MELDAIELCITFPNLKCGRCRQLLRDDIRRRRRSELVHVNPLPFSLERKMSGRNRSSRNSRSNGTGVSSQSAWVSNSNQPKPKPPAAPKPVSQVKSFDEIKKKHLQAAQKHAGGYESSSEEELESDSLLQSVFKGYSGEQSQLKKTQQFLENVFQSGTATCLICIATVKRSDFVSSCHPSESSTLSVPSPDLVVFALLQLLPLELRAAMGAGQHFAAADAAGE